MEVQRKITKSEESQIHADPISPHSTCTARQTGLTSEVVVTASMHAQFILPLSKVRATNAFDVASAIIFVPPSVVLPVNVTTKCWTSFSLVADTVSTYVNIAKKTRRWEKNVHENLRVC